MSFSQKITTLEVEIEKMVESVKGCTEYREALSRALDEQLDALCKLEGEPVKNHQRIENGANDYYDLTVEYLQQDYSITNFELVIEEYTEMRNYLVGVKNIEGVHTALCIAASNCENLQLRIIIEMEAIAMETMVFSSKK